MRLKDKKIVMPDGRTGVFRGNVIKGRKGWQYFVHLDNGGGCELLMRAEFKYVKRAAL